MKRDAIPSKSKISAALKVLETEGAKIYHVESVPDKWTCIGAALYCQTDDAGGIIRLVHEFFEQWNGHTFCELLVEKFPGAFRK
jgi:hypothetical protein